MSEGKQKWSAELNHNYRDDEGKPMWILRYDPTPGGTVNEDGSRSFSMNFPALQLTSWVAEPETSAKGIALCLNVHDELLAALQACVHEMGQNHPGDNSFWKAVEDADAAIAKATGAA